jgi:pyruvate formate lyase activating enzyme
MQKEALFYEKLHQQEVRCLLCPHLCLIAERKTGNCKVRTNHNGVLYASTYGKICAANIDPIEKKPLYHFLPNSTIYSIATAGCNFHCQNCQNHHISQCSPEDSNYQFLSPSEVIKKCLQAGCKSIAYTYTEPTVYYEYMLDIAQIASANNIFNVMISNGYIMPEPLQKLTKFLNAANIDLKSFDDKVYNKLTGGNLQPVLDSIITLKESGVWLEVTNLIIPQYTDNMDTIRQMCRWFVRHGFQEIPLHFSRFVPLYKLSDIPATPLPSLETALEIALNEGMKYVYIGNVPNHAKESTFCPTCKEVLISRKGYFIEQNGLRNGNCAFCNTPISGKWH